MDPATRNDSGQIRPSDRLGKYTIVRELGQGGMAEVFEGRHPELECPVALKVLRPLIASQPRAVARFLREAKAAAQIRHPNIVRVFDIGTHQDVPFIVMEFLEGEDLASLLVKKGPLPVSAIVELFLPVISAVGTAHAAGVVHRDLKPSNLVLTRRPPRGVHPFVLDFGISKILSDEGEGALTRSESLLGTVQYMAPELTRGAKFATEQSDQYAIGVMLFECATGRRPFSGDSQYELMHAIVTAPVVAPSSIDRLIPPEFDAIVLRAMARDPVNRFPSVHALGRALHPLGSETARKLWEREFWQTGEPDLWSAAPPTRCDEPVATQRRRKPALPRRAALQLAAVGVGVAAASAVWSAWRQPEPSHQAFLGALAASQAGASQPKAAPVEHAEPGPPPPPSVGKTDPSSRRGEILNGAEESEPKPRLSPAAAWVSPPRADPVGPKPPSDAQGKKTDRAGLHPASSQPARSSPQLGTNGALIID